MLISKLVLNNADFFQIILDPMFEKVILNNAIVWGGPYFFILDT